MGAHALDANTVALWRCNDAPAAASRLHAVDSTAGNLRPLIGAAASSSPSTVWDAAKARWVRRWAANQELTCASNAADPTVLTGNYTIEALIYASSLAAIRTIFSFDATGETLATNYLIKWQISTAGLQSLLWESGAGVNQSHAQSTGTAITAAAWHYVAVTKDATNVKFYLDGALVQTVAITTASAGGTGSTLKWYAGATENGADDWIGDMAGFRCTTSAKSAADITAVNTALGSAWTLPLEAGTHVLWKMDSSSDVVVDSGTNAIHLAPITATAMQQGGHSLCLDGGSSLYVNNTYAISAAANADAGVNTLLAALKNAFTIEWWMKVGSPFYGIRGVWVMGDPGSALAIQNFLAFDIMADRTFRYWSEYGTDLDSTHQTTYALPDDHLQHHIAVRRNATGGGGTHTVDILVDGVVVETLTGIQPYASGTNAAFQLGTGVSSAVAPIQHFVGHIDDVKISNIALSDAVILEDYQRGMETIVPVISSATPAPGAITKTQAVSFSVTDADAGLTPTHRVMVTATYGSDFVAGVTTETVYSEAGFSSKFSAGSTAGGTSSARTFSLARTGGWPSASVTLLVRAIDVHGNATTTSFAYTTDFLGPVAPTIPAYSPASGAIDNGASITVDVTDTDVDLARIIIHAVRPDGITELIHDGLTSGFETSFSGSSNNSITGGRRLVIGRSGGWGYASFTLRTRAIDALGFQTTRTADFTTNFVTPAVPVIAAYAPPSGAIDNTDSVTVSVTDVNGDLLRITIYSERNDGITELVHDGLSSGFEPGFSGSTNDAITNGRELVISKTGGWGVEEFTLRTVAIDGAGGESTHSADFTTDFVPAPTDVADPQITNIVPADQAIRKQTVVEFDVTDDILLAYTGIIAVYPDGTQDVVYDGFEFGPNFAESGSINTKTVISGGFHFRIRRSGGWLKAPSIKPAMVDAAGNLGVIS